jgi:hypothetical protein
MRGGGGGGKSHIEEAHVTSLRVSARLALSQRPQHGSTAAWHGCCRAASTVACKHCGMPHPVLHSVTAFLREHAPLLQPLRSGRLALLERDDDRRVVGEGVAVRDERVSRPAREVVYLAQRGKEGLDLYCGRCISCAGVSCLSCESFSSPVLQHLLGLVSPICRFCARGSVVHCAVRLGRSAIWR